MNRAAPRRRTPRMARTGRGMAAIRLLMTAMAAGLCCAGCSTPEARYRTLSFFFDGVPEPGVPKDAAKEQTGTAKQPQAAPETQFSLHPPYAERKCEVCHESQGSNQLKMDKSKVCGTCHAPDHFMGKSVHGPVAGGNCYACHDPHKSPNPHLLLETGSAICQKCHKPEDFGEQNSHRTEKGSDCLSCHVPHASDKDRLLK